MILRFILFALGIYIIYKVIFELIIPIFRTTKKIRRQFGDMQQRMEEQMHTQQNGFNKQAHAPEQTKTRKGDYIDFEEVESKTQDLSL